MATDDIDTNALDTVALGHLSVERHLSPIREGTLPRVTSTQPQFLSKASVSRHLVAVI